MSRCGWCLPGATRSGSLFGACPEYKPVVLMGMSHLRLCGAFVVEHWMVFDEIGALVQAYRA